MTDAVVTLSVFTGTDAATQNADQVGIDLVSVDSAVNSAGNRTAHKVAPGDNSFEKVVALVVDDANGKALSNFWVERSGDLPDGVVIKFGVTDTPTTPTDATSAIATMTMAEGRRYIFDAGTYSADGDRTRYLVLQEVVDADAASGAIDSQAVQVGWSEVVS